MRVELDIAVPDTDLPREEDFLHWAEAASVGLDERTEVSIFIADARKSAYLNQTYRYKSGPTNVLSFPFEVPKGVPNDLLGDLVICAEVVEREAHEQGKPPLAHWAHMVVHGMLHLRGLDHIAEEEAAIMEAREIEILNSLGFPNPYEEEDTPS